LQLVPVLLQEQGLTPRLLQMLQQLLNALRAYVDPFLRIVSALFFADENS